MMVFKSLRDRSLTYSPKLKGGSHFCFAFAFVPHGLDGFARTHYRVLRSLPITAVPLCGYQCHVWPEHRDVPNLLQRIS